MKVTVTEPPLVFMIIFASSLLSESVSIPSIFLKSNDVERLPTQPAKAAKNRNDIRNLELKMPDLIVFAGHDMPAIPKFRKDIVIVNPLFFKTDYLNIR